MSRRRPPPSPLAGLAGLTDSLRDTIARAQDTIERQGGDPNDAAPDDPIRTGRPRDADPNDPAAPDVQLGGRLREMVDQTKRDAEQRLAESNRQLQETRQSTIKLMSALTDEQLDLLAAENRTSPETLADIAEARKVRDARALAAPAAPPDSPST